MARVDDVPTSSATTKGESAWEASMKGICQLRIADCELRIGNRVLLRAWKTFDYVTPNSTVIVQRRSTQLKIFRLGFSYTDVKKAFRALLKLLNGFSINKMEFEARRAAIG
jgi:hypothetical protein